MHTHVHSDNGRDGDRDEQNLQSDLSVVLFVGPRTSSLFQPEICPNAAQGAIT
jgi:hypothetical protein